MNNLPPSATQVRPGAHVAIVLKADQRTGRTVRGAVRDVLTRGCAHPRGIKVRLVDGRVGRVQSMAPGGGGGPLSSAAAGGSSSSRQCDRGDDGLPAQQQVGLDAFVVGRKRGKGTRRAREEHGAGPSSSSSSSSAAAGAIVACPVCGAFEGDEAAVSHHVAGHFDGQPASEQD